MKDITTTPTADLIAELLELENNAKADPVSLEDVYARIPKAKRHSEICYELDKRAITDTRNLEHDIMTLAANGNITAKEQHDLETWLLIKNTP